MNTSDPIQRIREMSAQFREILAKLYASIEYRVGGPGSVIGVHYEIGTFSLTVNANYISARLDIGHDDDSQTIQFYRMFHPPLGARKRSVRNHWNAETLDELVKLMEIDLIPIIRGFDERKSQIEIREREIRRLHEEIKQLAAGFDSPVEEE
mgnify:CR=1 FL=1